MKTIKIELVKKTNEHPYYCVSSDPYEIGTLRVFHFKEDAEMNSTWSKDKAFLDAKEYALQLKVGITETRELIETINDDYLQELRDFCNDKNDHPIGG